MPMWLWILIGLGGFLALSLVVGFTVAAVLGTIGRQITELHSELDEAEEWAMLPTGRASEVTDEPVSAEEGRPSRAEELEPR
jgi:hypothetical protein